MLVQYDLVIQKVTVVRRKEFELKLQEDSIVSRTSGN